MEDERYFDVINRSAHANYHIDMSTLYDYYDIDYDANGNRPYITDSDYINNSDTEPEPRPGCMDSTALNYNVQADQDDGSCTYAGGDNGDNNDIIDDNNGIDDNLGTDDNSDTCTGICDEDVSDSTKSDESDPIVLLSVVMGVIMIAAITVIFMSKEKETLADGIEKEDQAFVPELPPMDPPKDSD